LPDKTQASPLLVLSEQFTTGTFHVRETTMSKQIAFDEALDAAEKLDAEGQAELAEILKRRLAERGRERVAATVEQARREFAAGQCQPMTAAGVVRETQS
jgi:tryptophanase